MKERAKLVHFFLQIPTSGFFLHVETRLRMVEERETQSKRIFRN